MKRGVWIFKWIVLGAIFIALFGLITQYLWNWLVPDLFSGPVITYWQALGLLLLTKILWGFGGSGKKRHCQHCGYGGKSYWKHRYENKIASMNPEYREAFKKKMMEKWCGHSQSKDRKNSSEGEND